MPSLRTLALPFIVGLAVLTSSSAAKPILAEEHVPEYGIIWPTEYGFDCYTGLDCWGWPFGCCAVL